MSHSLVKCIFAALGLTLFGGCAFSADSSFASGYAGSLPTSPRDRARTYFARKPVQAVIFALEKAPLARAEAERMLTRDRCTPSPSWGDVMLLGYL
jgi:hypothetical protein